MQISMMGGMIKDVIDFLMLLILVLLGFAGALTTLFASDVDIEDDPGYVMTDPDCVMLMGRNSSFIAVSTAPHSLSPPRSITWRVLELTPGTRSRSPWHMYRTQVFKNLFEGSLLEDSPFVACISQSAHPVI